MSSVSAARESTLLDDFEKDSKAPSIHSHIPMHYVNNTSLTSRKLDGTLGRCTTCAAFGRSRALGEWVAQRTQMEGALVLLRHAGERSSCSGTPERASCARAMSTPEDPSLGRTRVTEP